MLSKIDSWQDRPWLWLLMSFVTIGLTCVAHYFFQDYLYMQACEQCVYIRYAMLVMGFGGLVAFAFPRAPWAKIIGYSLGAYGCIIGIDFCLTLDKIHTAIHDEDAFGGVAGCREIPIFPFDLHLYKWAPEWFLPTGDCGLDQPVVPADKVASLSAFQQFFTGTEAEGWEDGFYSQGWYLIPSMHFMNMAIACLLCFVSCAVALAVMAIGYFLREGNTSKIVVASSIAIAVVLVILGNMGKAAAIAAATGAS